MELKGKKIVVVGGAGLIGSHTVGAIEGGFEYVGLQDVAADVEHAHAWVAQRTTQIFGAAANKVVVDDDFLDIFFDQQIDGV